MKTLLITLFATLLLNGASFAHSNLNGPGNDDDKVQVVVNSSTGDATITWNDNRIEFIEILSSNGQFMPIIPVDSAKSLHMNDLMDGTYTLIFKSSSETLYTKTVLVSK